SARKEGKGARRHRRGPINTRLSEGNAHLRTNAISVAREKGAIHKQPRKRDLCRAYAVKSGFTPPEGNRYLLFNSQMIAWRPHRRQWILVTLPIQYSNPCARGNLATSLVTNTCRIVCKKILPG